MYLGGQAWVFIMNYDLISNHLTPASLEPPISMPNSSWDSIGMTLYKGLQEDHKIRDMNRVALLERNYCSSFFCCDIRLSGFHELLEHIEKAHFVLTKDKNGNKRYLYQPVDVSNLGRLLSPHQQPQESYCSPFDADCEFEMEYGYDGHGYTDPVAFCGYPEDEWSRSSSPSPSPTVSSTSSSASSPMMSPLSLPTRAPALSASPPPPVPKTTAVAPTSHPSPSSPSSIPLIAPIPSTPNHYDHFKSHGARHYQSKRASASSSSQSRVRMMKQLSRSHHKRSTITAAVTGTGSRKRGPSSCDREKLYRCSAAGCTKAYLNPNGLKYHLEKGKCSFEEDVIIKAPR